MNTDRLLYAPDAFAASDPVSIVREYPFALLVTDSSSGTLATNMPIFFETDSSETTLVGHLARKNPQAGALVSGMPALAVFSGPHTYIASSWYREKLTVPTWNYISAQVRGILEPIDDSDAQLRILARTAQVLERNSDPPWSLDQAPPGRVDFLLPQIRSFRITVQRIEGVTKLNQTHPVGDQHRIIERLLVRNSADDVQIAQLMASRITSA